ncbi:NAD(P)-dependent oxidoreductase [Microbacterium paludicola]|nr:NAD(P)-dependent oxidoreductase [Microbacterium paludicola]MBF0817179.1 hydroxyacid dehydrogenase [Microbacterium paludicola]
MTDTTHVPSSACGATLPRTALVLSKEHLELAGPPPEGARLALWDDLVDGRIEPESVEFALLGGFQSRELRERLRDLPNLVAVRTVSIGYDWLVDHLPPGVAVYNSSDVMTDTTAETGALGLIAALRAFPEHLQAQRDHRWIGHDRRGATEHGVQGVVGSTILVLGQGGVGRGIAERLEAFKARVVRFARTTRTGARGERVHAFTELDQWLPLADAVSLALPLNVGTERLVDADFLSRMKPGAVLGNVGRGRVVDTDALIAAAREGRVRAALDVVDPEPLPADHPLWDVPGVSITPHAGASSRHMRDNIGPALAAMAGAYLRGEDLGAPAFS